LATWLGRIDRGDSAPQRPEHEVAPGRTQQRAWPRGRPPWAERAISEGVDRIDRERGFVGEATSVAGDRRPAGLERRQDRGPQKSSGTTHVAIARIGRDVESEVRADGDKLRLRRSKERTRKDDRAVRDERPPPGRCARSRDPPSAGEPDEERLEAIVGVMPEGDDRRSNLAGDVAIDPQAIDAAVRSDVSGAGAGRNRATKAANPEPSSESLAACALVGRLAAQAVVDRDRDRWSDARPPSGRERSERDEERSRVWSPARADEDRRVACGEHAAIRPRTADRPGERMPRRPNQQVSVELARSVRTPLVGRVLPHRTPL
jgi:hypothetical protein